MELLLLVLVLGVSAAEEVVDTDYHNHVGIPLAARIRAAERNTARENIVGGSPAKPGEFPYFGGLIIELVNGKTSLCGSTLISPTRCVTAAHCWRTRQAQARQFTVVLGSTKLFSGGTRIPTNQVEAHADFNMTNLANDIAMVKIAKVNFNDNIRSIRFATGSNNFAGVLAEAIGFGATADGGQITKDQYLSHASVRVISNSECTSFFGNRTVKVSTLCTSTRDGRSTCGGDSGGPLVANNQLIGVTSFGQGCQSRIPNGFSRITFYAPWIQARM